MLPGLALRQDGSVKGGTTATPYRWLPNRRPPSADDAALPKAFALGVERLIHPRGSL